IKGELAPPHRVRTKRCACNNQLDSECHYFCHLDIIWVNTPSKTTVYGLGSPLSRRRRSAGRCVCADSDDHTCTSFCVPSRGGMNLHHNVTECSKGQCNPRLCNPDCMF
uniref:Endothelin-like toxin domain-containing protein n=1 Tax=Salmo trutta TaxID=8032 RepID=A0A674E3H6_SALTR